MLKAVEVFHAVHRSLPDGSIGAMMMDDHLVFPPASYVKVATLRKEITTQVDWMDWMLNWAYSTTQKQSTFAGLAECGYDKLKSRSSCPGDLFRIDGVWFRVCQVGFLQFGDDYTAEFVTHFGA
jgi:hypothetical protein